MILISVVQNVDDFGLRCSKCWWFWSPLFKMLMILVSAVQNVDDFGLRCSKCWWFWSPFFKMLRGRGPVSWARWIHTTQNKLSFRKNLFFKSRLPVLQSFKFWWFWSPLFKMLMILVSAVQNVDDFGLRCSKCWWFWSPLFKMLMILVSVVQNVDDFGLRSSKCYEGEAQYPEQDGYIRLKINFLLEKIFISS